MAGPTDKFPDEVLLERIRRNDGQSLRRPTWGELYIAEALLLLHQDLANLVWELRALKEGWPNGSY